jgi:pimeloyl-ACP methyl ester carboxylesterase
MRRSLIAVVTLLTGVLLTSAFVGAVAAAGTRLGPGAIEPSAAPAANGSPRSFSHLPDKEPRSQSAPSSSGCDEGEQSSGAQYRICLPSGWDGEGLVVYAHGYVAPDRPVEIPEEQMVLRWDGQSISVTEAVTGLGFAFATTSYYTNGLAVRPAISDLLDLVDIFTTTKGTPNHVYLVGVSEGGLITALSIEEYPDVYDGGLAMCGPYGDFRGQINHFGDFRVVFDYFFPGVMPGEPFSIPTSLMEEWETVYTETIFPTITHASNVTAVSQLLQVTDVSPYAFAPPTSTGSIEQLLWYNVFATNDGVKKLGGQPFDNHDRVYEGSADDATLNQMVERITATQAALDEIEAHYQTSGRLSVPLVTVHTTGDPVVPYWHATAYESKVLAAGSELYHEHILVDRHGHCAFNEDDVMNGFLTLLGLVGNPPSHVYLPVVTRAP